MRNRIYNYATYWLTCDSTYPWNRLGFFFVFLYLFVLPALLGIAFSEILGGFFAGRFWLTIVGVSIWVSAFLMQLRAKARLREDEDCQKFVEEFQDRRKEKYNARRRRGKAD